MHECRPIDLSDDQIARLLRALPKLDPPPLLHAQVEAAIHAEQRRQRRNQRYLIALATGLQLLVVVIYGKAAR